MNRQPVSGTEGYANEAPLLFKRYENFEFTQVHAPVLQFFPKRPSRIVDIGAGTGRDAAHMASQGHCVIAVEPTSELREPAALIRRSQNLEWLDDSLPNLSKLLDRGETFDLVMLNAVWMHLDKRQREVGMRNIARLTRSGSRVVMSLRHGPIPNGRRMFDVSGDETVQLGRQHGFKSLFNAHSPSIQEENRAAGVSWTRVVLEHTEPQRR
ncbi:MAG: class I SAM-dependent methyltransferase [Pseudomonadales bacterium]